MLYSDNRSALQLSYPTEWLSPYKIKIIIILMSLTISTDFRTSSDLSCFVIKWDNYPTYNKIQNYANNDEVTPQLFWGYFVVIVVVDIIVVVVIVLYIFISD